MLKIKLKMRGITTQLNLSPLGLTFQLLTVTYVKLLTMSNTVYGGNTSMSYEEMAKTPSLQPNLLSLEGFLSMKKLLVLGVNSNYVTSSPTL